MGRTERDIGAGVLGEGEEEEEELVFLLGEGLGGAMMKGVKMLCEGEGEGVGVGKGIGVGGGCSRDVRRDNDGGYGAGEEEVNKGCLKSVKGRAHVRYGSIKTRAQYFRSRQEQGSRKTKGRRRLILTILGFCYHYFFLDLEGDDRIGLYHGGLSLA